MKTVKQMGNLVQGGRFANPQRGRVYDVNGVSPCIYTFQGGGLEPKIVEIYEGDTETGED